MAISKSLGATVYTDLCHCTAHVHAGPPNHTTVDVEAVIHIAKDSNGLGIYMGQVHMHVSSINNYLNSARSQ